MLYDFMKQIISRLDGIEKKVDANQQNFERIVRKIEKRKVSTTVILCYLHLSLNTLSFADKTMVTWATNLYNNAILAWWQLFNIAKDQVRYEMC